MHQTPLSAQNKNSEYGPPGAETRAKPALAPVFEARSRQGVDARLVVGAALFGVGWGASGFCPGPALVSLMSLSPPVWLFVAAMAAGMAVLWPFLLHRGARP